MSNSTKATGPQFNGAMRLLAFGPSSHFPVKSYGPMFGAYMATIKANIRQVYS